MQLSFPFACLVLYCLHQSTDISVSYCAYDGPVIDGVGKEGSEYAERCRSTPSHLN